MIFIPEPKSVQRGEGAFTLRYDTQIVLSGTPPQALLAAELLRDAVRERTGLALCILRGAARPGDVELAMDGGLAEDRYRLSVTPRGVRVSGGSYEAMFSGVQTLIQWVQRCGAALGEIEIEDWPDIANRCYYLDVSRGRVPTLDTLKRYADLLCRYKINQWQLYVEHTYLFRDFSEAWRDDTPLTAEEIMELDAYCRARCIELVPSLSTFGHMYKLLSTKTLCELCELPDSEKIPYSYTYAGDHHTLNVSHDGALALILRMIDEYMELFTSRKFNICADETFDLGKGRSAGLKQELGERALYMNHVKAMCEYLVSKGRTPMFWGDIVWRYPEAYGMLPKETVCLNWGYLPDQREDEIRALAQAGATQYACPGVCGWNRWFPLVRSAFANNRVMCAHGRKYGAIGHLNTDWGDYGHINHPWFTVPGILFGAAFSWNAEPAEFDELCGAISFLEYGDTSETFMRGFAALSEHEVFDWFHAVRFIEAKTQERRRELFAEIAPGDVPEANAAIDAALAQVRDSLGTMPPQKRELMQAIDLVADGVKLWNDIAVYIGRTCYGVPGDGMPGDGVPGDGVPGDAGSGEQLAARLERWFRAYTLLWRGVSKEAGLPRTLKIVTDYADFLRGRVYGGAQ